VGDVIHRQVEEAMLGKRRALDPSGAEKKTKESRAVLKIERQLREELARLRAALKESREELECDADHVLAVVAHGLDLAGQPPLVPVSVDRDGVRVPAYRLPPLRGTWAACAEGLAHPHTGTVRPMVFDQAVAAGHDDVVLVHLNHRLVQMCTGLLRAETWSPGREGSGRALKRVTARATPGLDAPLVVAHARLLILGADSARLHEEIVTAGGTLKKGRFARASTPEIEAALHAASHDAAPADDLVAGWPAHRDALVEALDTRVRDRAKTLAGELSRRVTKEVENLTAVLLELKARIEEELSEGDEPQQLFEFAKEEREQFERNKASLKARVLSIPGEIERETAALRARFATQTSRVFPVAVTYLVPAKKEAAR
jgi:hypothetical protein